MGFKEHLDWLKIDSNAAEIIIVQDYNKNKSEWKYTYTVFKLRVKVVIYESNIMTTIDIKAPDLVVHFSYHTLMTFLMMLPVILLSILTTLCSKCDEASVATT